MYGSTTFASKIRKLTQNLLSVVRIDVNEGIYIKDPHSSELGRDILTKGLPAIHELGMERFTFKRLASDIGTTESAIYRYFENKHKLLLYYVAWYWGFMEYNLVFGIANIESPQERLLKAIRILTVRLDRINEAPFDLRMLEQVVVAESAKAYLTKDVDAENKEGHFTQFKSVCSRFSELIQRAAPAYANPKALALLFVESHLGQLYFARHFAPLTDLCGGEEVSFEFYKKLIFNTIQPWQETKPTTITAR
jgi:AcrR family transcriptional regulator